MGWMINYIPLFMRGCNDLLDPRFNEVEMGYTGFTLSVCPSVRLWTESCVKLQNLTWHKTGFVSSQVL